MPASDRENNTRDYIVKCVSLIGVGMAVDGLNVDRVDKWDTSIAGCYIRLDDGTVISVSVREYDKDYAEKWCK